MKKMDKQKECCLVCGAKGVEVHHPLIYAGKKISDIFVPLCTECHRGDNGTIWQYAREVSEMAAIESNIKYLKSNCGRLDWERKLSYLKNKYEKDFKSGATRKVYTRPSN